MNNLQRELKKLSPYNTIFQSNEDAMSLCVRHGILAVKIASNSCTKSMGLSNSAVFNDGKVYRCTNKCCRKKYLLRRVRFFLQLMWNLKNIESNLLLGI
jgi:hypothetical protein